MSDTHNWPSLLREVRSDFKSFIENECWEWVHQVADQDEESQERTVSDVYETASKDSSSDDDLQSSAALEDDDILTEDDDDESEEEDIKAKGRKNNNNKKKQVSNQGRSNVKNKG